MRSTRHLTIDDDTLVLCTHEDAGPAITGQTVVRALDTSNLAVRWTAKPIPGEVRTLRYISSLNILVLSSYHDITNHLEERDHPRIRTIVVVLDARNGKRRAMDTVDSDVQGSFIVGADSSVPNGKGFFVSSDVDEPVVGLAWKNGDVLTVSLKKFIAAGFEREGDGGRARTVALFPADVTIASMGRKGIFAVAGAKRKKGKVMFAKCIDKLNAGLEVDDELENYMVCRGVLPQQEKQNPANKPVLLCFQRGPTFVYEYRISTVERFRLQLPAGRCIFNLETAVRAPSANALEHKLKSRKAIIRGPD
ncbi:hypothetical protein DFH06DRAFT_1307183 [Mycena polygramma]|nr:hypothetical protein DFH06DRAFT_1307183 [Mycena polygramma]